MFLETICLKKGVFQHLEYHEHRMFYTIEFELMRLNKPALSSVLNNKILINGIPSVLPKHKTKAKLTKCRILYDCDKIIDVEYLAYKPKPPKTLQIVEVDEFDYSFKYADRSAIEALQARKGKADDVLIVQNDFILDTSYCNVAFFDGKVWHTPISPLLEGTTRSRLLDEEKIELASIRPEYLQRYQRVRLFNAMLDFEDAHDIEISNIYL